MTPTMRAGRTAARGAPRRVARRTAADVEAQILEGRASGGQSVGAGRRTDDRVGTGGARCGSAAVAHDRADLDAGATGRTRLRRRASKASRSPALAAERSCDQEQVDFVRPRHSDGGVRFHALNQVDICSHHAGIEIVIDRADERVVAGLHALCRRHGMPCRVQFDNCGPFSAPTGVGEVMRFRLRRQPRRVTGDCTGNDQFSLPLAFPDPPACLYAWLSAARRGLKNRLCG